MVGVQCHRDYHEQVDLSGLLSAFQILKSPSFGFCRMDFISLILFYSVSGCGLISKLAIVQWVGLILL